MADQKTATDLPVDGKEPSAASTEAGKTPTTPKAPASDKKPATKRPTVSPSVRDREGLKLDCLLVLPVEERIEALTHFNLPHDQFLGLTSLLELHEWLIFHDVNNYVFPRTYLWHLLTLSNENRNKCLECQDLGRLEDSEARTVGDLIRWIATQDLALMRAEIEKKPVYRKWSFLDRVPSSSERLPLRECAREGIHENIRRRLSSEDYGKSSRSTQSGDQL